MKVVTLRKLTRLPDPYKDGDEFFVRVQGVVSSCTSLHEAKLAAAYWPQEAPVTLMTPSAYKKYLEKREKLEKPA